MHLKLKNIGVLREAEIDLTKKLIIFCGPNNSGKTYAAYTTYGLYKFSERPSRFFTETPLFPKLNQLFENGTIEIDLFSFFKENHDLLIKEFSRKFINYLPNVFASDETLFKDASIELDISIDLFSSKLIEIELRSLLRFGHTTSIQFTKEIGSTILNIIYIDEGEKKEKPTTLVFINEILQDKVFDFLTSIIFNNSYITPAERIAINIFSTELSLKRNSIVDELLEYKEGKKDNPLDIMNRRAKRYSLPIRESLEIAEDLENLQKNKSNFASLADWLEERILKGKIKISKNGDVLFDPIKSKKKNFNIHLTASLVKSLSNLVIYFRHIAKENDFVIIDEPELNLHPDNQRLIARLIAKMVNAGFKVMISTHSDYIIRELNNLIMLNVDNDTAKKLITKYNYSKDELLDYNSIGAYLFDNKKNTKIDVSEIGFEVASIDEVINSLNNIAQDIYFSLHN